MKRKRNRSALLVPDGRGSWAIIHAGETVLSGVDRYTALHWASRKGLRVRVPRLVAVGVAS